MVYVDCRGFQTTKQLRGHVGLNGGIMQGIVLQDKFPKVWQGLKRSFLHQLETCPAGGNVAVVFYCEQGFHSSVAMGALFKHICDNPGQGFNDKPKFTVAPVMNLSLKPGMPAQCGPCQSCFNEDDRAKYAKVYAMLQWIGKSDADPLPSSSSGPSAIQWQHSE